MKMLRTVTVLVVLVCVHGGAARASEIAVPSGGWEFMSQLPPPISACDSGGALESGFYFTLDGASAPNCSGCTAYAYSDHLALGPAGLRIELGMLAGITRIEVDLTEYDPELSARVEVRGGAQSQLLGSALAPATGAITLEMDTPGDVVGWVTVECCDCDVREVRFIGANIVGDLATSWTLLKSQFAR